MPSPSAGQHTPVFVHKLFPLLVQAFSLLASWMRRPASAEPMGTPTAREFLAAVDFDLRRAYGHPDGAPMAHTIAASEASAKRP
jgi:hypothetical protein